MTTRMLKWGFAIALAIGFAGCSTMGGSSSSGPVAGATLDDKPVDIGQAKRGGEIWVSKSCYTCHAFGKRLAGPDLMGVMERRDHAWLRAWLLHTDSMIASDDPQVKAMVEEWKGVKMPNMKLQDSQIDALFHYMAQETARARAETAGS